MAASTSLHPLHQSHGLPVGGGHGLHRLPGEGMLSRLELVSLGLVTHGTFVRLHRPCHVNVFLRHVPGAMAHGAGDEILAMLA